MKLVSILFFCLITWQLTAQTCYTFNNSNSPLPGNNIEGIYIASDNSKWFATNQGAVHFTDTSWTVYNALNSGLTETWIKEITEDNLGNIWFATVLNGVFKFDGSTWTHFTQSTGLPANVVYDILTDQTGTVWICGNNGNAFYDGSGWVIKNTSNVTGFPSPAVFDLQENSTGTLWMASEGFGSWQGGASFFDTPTSCQNFTTINSSIISNTTRCILEVASGIYWIGTHAGISIYNSNTNSWSSFNSSNSTLTENYISDIEMDANDRIWVGSNLGLNQSLSYFDLNTLTWFGPYNISNTCLGSNTIKDIEIDNLGNVWIATPQGVTVFNLSGIQISNSFSLLNLIANNTNWCSSEQAYFILNANGGFGTYDFDIAGIGSFQNMIDGDTIWYTPANASYIISNASDALGNAPISNGTAINVMVSQSYQLSENITICNNQDYTLPNGNIVNSTGIYFSNLTSIAGCDSIIETNLDVITPVTTTSIVGSSIIANAFSPTYQWLDCSDNSVISGENSASFTPTQNGNYAVVIDENGCQDTSDCILIENIGLDKNEPAYNLIFPNPSNGKFTINLNQIYKLNIYNLSGELVFSTMKDTNIECNLPDGVYFIHIYSKENTFINQKLIILN